MSFDMLPASMLDATLDDLADLPSFKKFPAGAYHVAISFAGKTINDSPYVEMNMRILDVLELNDPAEVPPAVGDESSVLFSLENEFGQGKLKNVLAPLGEHFGISGFVQIMEAAEGMEVAVVTKLRHNKDKTDYYQEVVAVTIP